MRKRGRYNRSFKTRFFVLYRGIMRYYSSSQGRRVTLACGALACYGQVARFRGGVHGRVVERAGHCVEASLFTH